MNWPDYTDGGNVAKILATLLSAPADRKFVGIAARILAKSFRDNPALPAWYRLPIVALAAELLSAIARSEWYRPVPNEPTPLGESGLIALVERTQRDYSHLRRMLERSTGLPEGHGGAKAIAYMLFDFMAEYLPDHTSAEPKLVGLVCAAAELNRPKPAE